MKTYLELLEKVYKKGTFRMDRTGTGTLSLFGEQIRFDISDTIPLLTTKSIHLKSVVGELLWFLNGETNIKPLQKDGVHIWDAWATDTGRIGPMYGYQWRKWGGKTDQLSNLIENLKKNPSSRRHVISAWEVDNLPDESLSPQKNVLIGNMALAPCHCLYQFYVVEDKLSCQVYIRSSDVYLGLPFNIASYAILTYMIAQQTDLKPQDLIVSLGDVHLYCNHTRQMALQLTREPKALPKLHIAKAKDLFSYCYEDFVFQGYEPWPAIPAQVAV